MAASSREAPVPTKKWWVCLRNIHPYECYKEHSKDEPRFKKAGPFNKEDEAEKYMKEHCDSEQPPYICQPDDKKNQLLLKPTSENHLSSSLGNPLPSIIPNHALVEYLLI